MTGNGKLTVHAYGATDVGLKREHNEDHYLIASDVDLYVVADGMGGHAGGETASLITTQVIERVVRQHCASLAPDFLHDDNLESHPAAKLLSDALRSACMAVHQKSQADSHLLGMGTTATALFIHNGIAYVGHVGDSRAYLVRNEQILQLSEDHSLVNEQIKAGLITKEQARLSRFRNVITRSIGFEEDVDVDMTAVTVMPGDTFLLCSDGLTNLLTDEEIFQTICDAKPPLTPKMLIDEANLAGGDDNITVVTVCVAK